MKAIIVDDEKHVREGLLLLADWKRFGIDTIYEADNGIDAEELISVHKPEIIFTDMEMPRQDGIGLLRWIDANPFPNKTIVVSGYDDYKYMRNAIHFGSFDYILKPIDPQILNETLERAVHEWRKIEQLPIELDQPQSSMQKIEEYIRTHYQEDIKLQQIADEFYLSREYISRKFKQEYNVTIIDFLTNIRMEKAKELLRNRQIKIYEIAYHTGYQNDKYFCKVFKKAIGLTPNEYRSSIM